MARRGSRKVMPEGIAIDHRVMGGVPCFAGTRIPIATAIGLLGQGYQVADVLAEYPALTEGAILAGLRFAAAGPPGTSR